ncbi:hypothetical protein HKX48_002852, partial [Thoreauomyces humboldtii]
MDNLKHRKITRDGLDFYTNRSKGAAVKDALVKLLDHNPDAVIIAFSRFNYGKGPYSEYAIVESKSIPDLISLDRQLFEIMHADRRQKLVFDIDFKGENSPLEDAKAVLEAKFLNARFNISGSTQINKEMRDGKLKTFTKFSYHIILENYFASCNDALRKQMMVICLENKHLGFDETVYKKDGQMKFINQSKGDGRVQKYISGSENVLDHTVLHNIPEDAIDIATLNLPTAICNESKKRTRGCGVKSPKVKKNKMDVLQEYPKMDIPPPADFDFFDSEPIQLLAALPNHQRGHNWQISHQTCTRVARWCKLNGMSFTCFWNWNKQKDGSDEREVRYHNYWNGINLEKFPVDDKLVQQLLLFRVYDKSIQQTAPARKLIQSYN